jgi:hypothetical protein
MSRFSKIKKTEYVSSFSYVLTMLSPRLECQLCETAPVKELCNRVQIRAKLYQMQCSGTRKDFVIASFVLVQSSNFNTKKSFPELLV